jgi:hypothetical protein
VDRLFRKTDNLLTLGASSVGKRDHHIREVLRYLAGPPLSEDDLKIIAGVNPLWSEQNLPTVVDVILSVIDSERFNWLTSRGRQPNKSEREAALRWTAGLLAAQKAGTERRLESSKRQEQAVPTSYDGIAKFRGRFT